ncbi:MAG TPA: cytochrome ubiquinol oxidase subunit I [Candidatus Margulisiibacteriota bacterium]|nr:cytochrome ubiquinol oxidase subunit I [Candidatus Margulisiibacteriota bacterium]
MLPSVAVLSRIQFALTVSFHFLFPPLTIGLGLMLVIIQALRLRTGTSLYLDMARFWTKVFGLVFAIGVATGIPLEFQFGTNWAQYARFVGDIFGSPLAIEGIYAFFLESGFLALLLFGWNKVGPRTHFFATCMVALGAHFSAIWILVANSWMQTPAGYHLARQAKVVASGQVFPMSTDLRGAAFTIREVALPASYVVQPEDLHDVRAVVDNFAAAILNPSTLDRLFHTILACWITGAFLVAAVSSWWLLRDQHVDSARAALKIGLVGAVVACLLQMVAADSTARGVARNQPTKLAALEGLGQSQQEAPLGIAGWVGWQRDAAGRIVGVESTTLHIPGLLSVLVSGDFLHPVTATATEVKGLAQLPPDDFLRRRHPGASAEELAKLRPDYWPNVPVLFQTYHLMIAIGMGLTAIAVLGCCLWKTGKLWATGSRSIRLFLGLLVLSPVLSEVATQAGWFTAEMGRQPWVVYQVLKTREAVSAVVSAPQVLSSLLLFFLVYLLLSGLFVSALFQLIRRGPTSAEAGKTLLETWQPLSLKAGRHTKGSAPWT